jgi:hypothetical protein
MKKQILAIISVLFVAACSQPYADTVTQAPTKVTQASTLLDKMITNGVPAAAAKEAMAKYEILKGNVSNLDWISIVDFTQHSGKKRFYIVNALSGAVTAIYVTHGSGSDPRNTGIPYNFSNTVNSHMTSLGAYLVSEKFYFHNHGESVKLDGLESTNSRARDRGIYLHPATYVSNRLSKMGMSWGCLAVSNDDITMAIERLSGGSFLYAYSTVKSTVGDVEIFLNQFNEGEGAPLGGD